MVRWEGGRFLVLLKGRGCRLGSRFHLFVSDVNQGNEGADWIQDFRVRSLVVSDLRSEIKGFQFESGCYLCAEVRSLK